MNDVVVIALITSIALNFLYSVAALVYFARTAWNAQAKLAELQRIACAQRMAENPTAAPMAHVVAGRHEEGIIGGIPDARTGRRELVRVPVAAPNGFAQTEPVFDEDGNVIG